MDAGPRVIKKTVRLQGTAADMYAARDRELLCTSGARCGKSFSIMVKAHRRCLEFPGYRVLFIRKTRRSLSETILQDWEDRVLGTDHPALGGGADRDNRAKYVYPNTSRVVLGGADKIDKVLSGQYDMIVYFQGEEELDIKNWLKLLTRLSNGASDYHQAICDVNPTIPTWWGLGRVASGKMRRLDYRLEDNPRWWDADAEEWTPDAAEYQEILDSLEGVTRDRLRDHLWVAATGLVWKTYGEARHLINADLELEDGTWFLHAPEVQDLPIRIEWFAMSQDFGYQAPGCQQVWAFDRAGRGFRVWECYHTGKDIEWWADRACEAYEKFRPSVGVSDHDPGDIRILNKRCAGVGAPAEVLDAKGGVTMPGLFREWSKLRGASGEKAGIDEVRYGFKHDRIFLVRGALRHARDPDLVARFRPTCTEEEIPAYVYPEVEDDKKIAEGPIKRDDHGIDAMRGMFTWVLGKDLSPAIPEPPANRFKPGSHDWLVQEHELEVERSHRQKKHQW